MLKYAEQFEHDYDNDNYSNDIEDASVHVGLISNWVSGGQHLCKSAGRRGIERSVPGQHRYSQPTDSPVYRITKRPIWRALCKKNVAMALCALTIP